MVQLIVGKKGKGKTKHLLDKVNAEVQRLSSAPSAKENRISMRLLDKLGFVTRPGTA